MMMSAPCSSTCRACLRLCTWQIVRAPACLILGINGPASPKDSMIPAGECCNARSSGRGPLRSGPGDEPATDALVAGRRQLTLESFRVGISAADDADPAGGADRGERPAGNE